MFSVCPRTVCTPTDTRWPVNSFLILAGYSLETFVSEIKNKVGNELMRTHRSYWSIIRKMIAGECVAALAHITGGGITENLPEFSPKVLLQ